MRRTLLIALSVVLVLTSATARAQLTSTPIIKPRNAPVILSDFKSSFGVNGRLRPDLHQGLDIAGRRGARVLAATDGRVLETDVGTCWGPTIVIDHGLGLDNRPIIAIYGHLGRIDVKAGDTVKRGEVIGSLGNNQRKYTCIGGIRHLHFQVGRVWKGAQKGDAWGHVKYLRDGKRGVNPHIYWADGPGRVTCFDETREFAAGSLTYPMQCR